MGRPLKRQWSVVAAAVLAASAPLWAGPSSQVAWTLATVRLVRAGNAQHGKALNKDCVDCHGPAGNIDTPEVPDLAGQNPLYTFKQLADYKAKLRTSDIMNDAVASLSERDMADLAAFYAAQPAHRPTPLQASAAAEKLAVVGDGQRLIPACDACHGDGGSGNSSFYGMPSLRSQKSVDLSAELKAFRSGQRGNDVYRVMRDVAARLTDAEIDALAAYYAGPAPVTTPAAAPAKAEKK